MADEECIGCYRRIISSHLLYSGYLSQIITSAKSKTFKRKFYVWVCIIFSNMKRRGRPFLTCKIIGSICKNLESVLFSVILISQIWNHAESEKNS